MYQKARKSLTVAVRTTKSILVSLLNPRMQAAPIEKHIANSLRTPSAMKTLLIFVDV